MIPSYVPSVCLFLIDITIPTHCVQYISLVIYYNHGIGLKKSLFAVCVEFGPGSYVVNYGFIYAVSGGQVYTVKNDALLYTFVMCWYDCLSFTHIKCGKKHTYDDVLSNPF